MAKADRPYCCTATNTTPNTQATAMCFSLGGRTSGRHPLHRGLGLTLALTLLGSTAAHAQQPYGWVANDHVSAYTLAPLEVELSGHYLWLDSGVDVFDMRDDILRHNPRVAGDTGDLKGERGAIRVGLWHGLDVFYQRQDQDLTVDVADSERAHIAVLDDRQETRSTAWGLKWVLYEAERKNRDHGWRSAALELIREENRSDDFAGRLTQVQLPDGSHAQFDTPQRFALDRLKDDRWQARLIYTVPFAYTSTLTTWLSYGESESSSGTSTEIGLPSVQQDFMQSFDVDEKQVSVGFSLNLQGRARLPVQLSYEYVHIHDRSMNMMSNNSTTVPSFLRASNMTEAPDRNHIVTASTSWWITPHMYVGATARMMRHQYVGLMPHLNNPLSSSFSDEMYGHLELKLGIRFGGLGLR